MTNSNLLPKTIEYALRAMAHLATLPSGTSVASAELAQAASLPPHYVSKLMRQLVVAKLVVSRRGHGGGFTLARAPESIGFSEILEAMNFAGDTQNCVFGWDRCSSRKPCPLHITWAELKSAFLTWAEQTTLGDVRDNWDNSGLHSAPDVPSLRGRGR